LYKYIRDHGVDVIIVNQHDNEDVQKELVEITLLASSIDRICKESFCIIIGSSNKPRLNYISRIMRSKVI